MYRANSRPRVLFGKGEIEYVCRLVFAAALSVLVKNVSLADMRAGIMRCSDTACLMGEAMRLKSTTTAPQSGKANTGWDAQALTKH